MRDYLANMLLVLAVAGASVLYLILIAGLASLVLR